MRCAECVTDPLTPGHYCECCGRKLSLEERGALKTAPVTLEAACHAPGHHGASPARCGSCGGPSADGDLCRSCQQAFGPVLGSTAHTAPAISSVTTRAEVVPLEATSSIASMSSSPLSGAPYAASPMKVASLPPISETVPASNDRMAMQRVDAAKAVTPTSERVHPVRAPRPAVLSTRPIVVVPPPRRTRSMVLATAAVVIVAAIGVLQGARWLGIQSPPQTVPEEQPEQPTPVVAIVAAAEIRETPVAKDRESRPPRAAGSALKKPTTSAKPLAPVAAALAPSPVPETPAPVEAAPRAGRGRTTAVCRARGALRPAIRTQRC